VRRPPLQQSYSTNSLSLQLACLKLPESVPFQQVRCSECVQVFPHSASPDFQAVIDLPWATVVPSSRQGDHRSSLYAVAHSASAVRAKTRTRNIPKGYAAELVHGCSNQSTANRKLPPRWALSASGVVCERSPGGCARIFAKKILVGEGLSGWRSPFQLAVTMSAQVMADAVVVPLRWSYCRRQVRDTLQCADGADHYPRKGGSP
jgi:hypothetical protein